MSKEKGHRPHHPSFGVVARITILYLLGTALALVALSCGKKTAGMTEVETTGTNPTAVAAAKVEKAFAEADPALRFPVDDALRLVKAGAGSDAVATLRKLAANPTLTAPQKQALDELIQNLTVAPRSEAPGLWQITQVGRALRCAPVVGPNAARSLVRDLPTYAQERLV